MSLTAAVPTMAAPATAVVTGCLIALLTIVVLRPMESAVDEEV